MQIETQRRSEQLGLEPRHVDAESDGERHGTYEVEIAAVRFDPPRIESGPKGSPLTIEIDLEPRSPIDSPIVVVSLHRVGDFVKAFELNTEADGIGLGRLTEPRTVSLSLDRLDLAPGTYRLDVGVFQHDWEVVYDYRWHTYPLEVVEAGGTFGPPRTWSAR